MTDPLDSGAGRLSADALFAAARRQRAHAPAESRNRLLAGLGAPASTLPAIPATALAKAALAIGTAALVGATGLWVRTHHAAPASAETATTAVAEILSSSAAPSVDPAAPPAPVVVAAPSAGPVTRPATPSSAPPDRPRQPASVAEQIAALDHARALLRSGDGAECMRTLAKFARDYPASPLALEAEVLRIEALAMSNPPAARGAGEAFLRAQPHSPYRTRVQSILAQLPSR